MSERTTGKAASCLLIVMLAGAYMLFPLAGATSPMLNNHPQPAIWKYENNMKYPTKGLVLTLAAGNEEQATAAAALVPAFINRKSTVALMFDDGSEARSVAIPHDTKKVSDFGADAEAATNKIATTYWSKAEIIVVTDNYEHALWAVPVASFLQAPIIVSPSSATLSALGTKYAVIVGGGSAGGIENIKLSTKEAVWTFQLELFDTKGVKCDYIVVTNPEDLTSSAWEWKGASLPSAILAAYRHAAVLTTGRCLPSDSVKTIAQGKSPEDELYDTMKPTMDGLRTDIRNAAGKVKSLGHSLKFMALVGGAFELPNYYIDVHQKWTIYGKEYGDDYACSVTPYANLTPPAGWNGTTYLKEDLATGRIVGHSVLDTTLMLARTMFYREFYGSGKYASLAPSGWEKNAAVLDAHNVSQPEALNFYPGYIPKEGVPYYPADEWESALKAAKYTAASLWLKNWTKDKSDPTCNVNAIWSQFSKSSICTEVGHGDPDSTWLEVGLNGKWPGWKAVVSFNYSSGKFHLVVKNCSQTPNIIVYNKDIPSSDMAPAIFTMISCYTGEISDGTNQTAVISSGFTHAGFVAFIGPAEYQTKCFWEFVPQGVGSMQGKLFVDKIATKNIAIGTAFAEAKWEAWQYWKNKGHADDRDAQMYLLYGDPALEPYKPNMPYKSESAFDVSVDFGEIKTGSDFSVKVTAKDLVTGSAVSGATVTVKYNGKTYNTADSSITPPKTEGAYPMEIMVAKAGYATVTLKYTTQVEKGLTDITTLLIFVVIILFVVVIAAIAMRKKPGAGDDEGAESEEEDDIEEAGEEGKEPKEEDEEDKEKEREDGKDKNKKPKGPKVLGED